MKKVLLTATVQSHICQFHRPLVEMLRDSGDVEIHVAAKNNLDQKPGLKLDFADQVFNVPFERSPFNLRNIRAFFELKKVIKSNEYDCIHCNTPVGGILTRLAAIGTRKKNKTKVIYTAHGFHFYNGAPLLNWLVYYPFEWFFSYFTDKLITINKEDYAIAKEKFHAKEVCYVPGVGVDVEKFASVQIDRVAKRREIGIPEDAVLLLSVGELNDNKNHQVIIKALAKLNNPKIHYAIAGGGEKKDYLLDLALQLGVADQFHLLGYRRDIAEINHCSDIFCFPSIREGLGLAAIEAMACGVPIVTSDVRGINDYSEQGVTGFKCSPQDVDSFAEVINGLICNYDFIRDIGKGNKERALKYSVDFVKKELKSVYES